MIQKMLFTYKKLHIKKCQQNQLDIYKISMLQSYKNNVYKHDIEAGNWKHILHL